MRLNMENDVELIDSGPIIIKEHFFPQLIERFILSFI
jgi:hypothetical protein